MSDKTARTLKRDANANANARRMSSSLTTRTDGWSGLGGRVRELRMPNVAGGDGTGAWNVRT
jgi:hypothetical protein